jgi:ferritin-like protein
MMNLSQNEKAAVRAFTRLLDVRTEGWDEAESADRSYDAGEWSGPAWADNWQRVEHECHREIALRFDLFSPEHVSNLVDEMENEYQHRHWLAHHLRFVVYGSMTDEKEDAQEVARFTSRHKAEMAIDRLNNLPSNHPDLAYWFEVEDERPFPADAYGEDLSDSTHKPICAEYHDRGLDCPCIPEGVKDAIRKGAAPEEVM